MQRVIRYWSPRVALIYLKVVGNLLFSIKNRKKTDPPSGFSGLNLLTKYEIFFVREDEVAALAANLGE
jgi:hypothetical protein